jgi:hypothetical protein
MSMEVLVNDEESTTELDKPVAVADVAPIHACMC